MEGRHCQGMRRMRKVFSFRKFNKPHFSAGFYLSKWF